jgi:hypothetical protein
MKPRHAAALALVVLASCGPDMATINNANERAERAAKRAQAAQFQAERSAELAADALRRTMKSADYIPSEGGGEAIGDNSPLWSAIKAQNAQERMCAFCNSCRFALKGAALKRYQESEAFRYKACSDSSRLVPAHSAN